MAEGGHLGEPIWDGNGGTLDPKKATQRDMLVALHIKMDSVVIPKLTELETTSKNLDSRLRDQESGELTRGQKAAIEEVFQADRDDVTLRRSLRAPIAAVVIALASLIATIVLTLTTVGGP